ncbi:HD domain-containing protein [Psychrobium sp. 1_MG-2023]|uniref:HD domain-containing protein n=1 Tax=Psychrobium sp. 1_MG-2023 TaxID=3062624 RepID=UPI000C329097|nr:HD domain-containing protein [Psychrobium sp. 1_MG-2023]MDP2560835.1 HD domain-containing protein [Psychrobium sp. 1_MG-2023]PKF56709.1 hydrolase [Alteromonadales bacterium alter-6D02]
MIHSLFNPLAWQGQFQQFVEQQMESDPAHDIAHIQRVVTTGLALTTQEQADLAITLPACWLHDCVNVDKKSPLRDQGSRLSADRAISFLQSINYPSEYYDAIHHAICAHSYSANIATETIEAEVVQDADRLDALGAIGLSRCLMLGATWGSQLYNPQDPFAQQRTLDDQNYCIDHFYVKLKGLVSTMKTDAGKNEAQKRWQFMQHYLDQLQAETGA